MSTTGSFGPFLKIFSSHHIYIFPFLFPNSVHNICPAVTSAVEISVNVLQVSVLCETFKTGTLNYVAHSKRQAAVDLKNEDVKFKAFF